MRSPIGSHPNPLPPPLLGGTDIGMWRLTPPSGTPVAGRRRALASLANADSIIAALDSKTYFILWRPITAIQLGDVDGHRETVGDGSWEPLLSTPSYASCLGPRQHLVQAIGARLAQQCLQLALRQLPQRKCLIERTSPARRDRGSARSRIGPRLHRDIAEVFKNLQMAGQRRAIRVQFLRQARN
jgi:hypothetical protein